MSDTVWLAIVGVFALAVKEYFDRERAKLAAAKVESVKVTLADATVKQDGKLDIIKETVNGNNSRLEDKIDELTKQLAESRSREARP